MKRIFLVMVLCVLSLNGAVFGETGRSRLKNLESAPMSYRWWIDIKPAKKINITEKEVERLDAVYKKTMTRIMELKLGAKKEILELEIELGKEKFNKSGSIKRFEKIQEFRSGIAVERFLYWMEIREIIGKKRLVKMWEGWHKELEENKRKLQVPGPPAETKK